MAYGFHCHRQRRLCLQPHAKGHLRLALLGGVYRFRLRPVTIAGVGGATDFPFAGEDQELVFTCHFEAPWQDGADMAQVQEGWCVACHADLGDMREKVSRALSKILESKLNTAVIHQYNRICMRDQKVYS